MEITEVRLRLVKEPGKLKASASITIDGCFVIHDLRVVDNEGKLFLAMPNKRINTGEYRDVAHPINSETREYVSKTVLDKYAQELSALSANNEVTE